MKIEAIASIIPIHLYLCKLSGRNQLRTATLSYNHVIKSLLERKYAPNSQLYHLSLGNMIFKQQQKIKSSIVDINNQLNRIFTTFDSLNFEFHPSSRLTDIFSSHISFHNTDQTSNESKEAYYKKLDEIILKSSLDPKTVVITTDTNVKNNITSSISHIHSFNNPLKKMLHHTINITLTEAELFAIRYGIN